MSRFLKTLSLGAGATLLSANLALASPKADTNNDGQITRAEFMAEANLTFINTDVNADGLLTEDERRSARQNWRDNRASEKFERLDRNGDGVISEAEYNARRTELAEKRRKRRDVNQDGIVNKADREALKLKWIEHRAERHDSGDPKDRIRADANQDGIITRAEFDAATEAMFVRMDANNDGVLTQGEGRKRKPRKKRGFWKRG